jgi:hypothetical protein
MRKVLRAADLWRAFFPNIFYRTGLESRPAGSKSWRSRVPQAQESTGPRYDHLNLKPFIRESKKFHFRVW